MGDILYKLVDDEKFFFEAEFSLKIKRIFTSLK